MFTLAFVLSIVIGIMFIGISLCMYYDGDEKLGSVFLGGAIICFVMFSILINNTKKTENIYYIDEYDLAQIKKELDVKEIEGTTKNISIKEREYIEIYLNRFDDKLYYEYAVHQNGVQLEDFEQYKITDNVE